MELLKKLKALQPAVELAKAEIAKYVDDIVQRQRELEGVLAAMRDPKTGIIYSGWSHQRAIESVPKDDDTGTWGRLSFEWDQATNNSGFLAKDGTFISRNEAEARWNILTMEDLKDAVSSKNKSNFRP